jgi:hypothetical protein
MDAEGRSALSIHAFGSLRAILRRIGRCGAKLSTELFGYASSCSSERGSVEAFNKGAVHPHAASVYREETARVDERASVRPSR